MKRLIYAGTALALAGTIATGCAYGSGTNSGTSSTGGSGSSGNSNPGCIPDMPDTCTPPSVQAGMVGGQPVVSADAVPQGEASNEPVLSVGDCSIDVFPAKIGLVAGANLVLAVAHSYCHVEPYSVSIVMTIQTCNKTVCLDGDFKDDPQSLFTDYRLPPQYPDYYLLHTDSDCNPGVSYRLFFKLWGRSAVYQTVDGVRTKLPGAPFGSKLNPITKAGAAMTYSASECTGK